MNKLQSERVGKIEKLKNILKKVVDMKRKVNKEEFICEVMSTMRVGRQSARGYIKQAQYEIDKGL